MTENITTFIFDMGGVLPGHTMREYIEHISETEEDEKLFKQIVKTSIWLELDGGLSLEDGKKKLCEYFNHEYDNKINTFIDNFRQVDDPNPKMEELVRELKDKGYKVYLMSNVSYNYKKFFKYIKSISYMDDIWVSCERKLMKPDREAFEDILNLFNLKAEECFFVDDSKDNIEAANAVGIRGFHYKGDVDELRAAI